MRFRELVGLNFSFVETFGSSKCANSYQLRLHRYIPSKAKLLPPRILIKFLRNVLSSPATISSSRMKGFILLMTPLTERDGETQGEPSSKVFFNSCLSCHIQEMVALSENDARRGKLRPFNLLKWFLPAKRQRNVVCDGFFWVLCPCSLMFHISDGFSCFFLFLIFILIFF